MPIFSVNYPVLHPSKDGEFKITTVDCDGNDTLIASGELYCGDDSGSLDVSQYARGVLTTDAITIPDFAGSPVVVQETGMMKDFKVAGITITQKDFSSDLGFNVQAVAYGNGTYVAVGSSDFLSRSTDGKNWTTQRIDVLGGIYSVTYGGGVFAAAGRDGYIVTSHDNGISWKVHKPSVVDWDGIEYLNGSFFAFIDDDQYIALSKDGDNWEIVTMFKDQWRCAAYGNGLYVVGSYDYSIALSKDGYNWDTSWVDGKFNDIIFNNGRFILVDYRGNLLVSSDAVTWESIYVGPGTLKCITYSDYLGMYFIGANTTIGGTAKGYYTSRDLKEFEFHESENIRDITVNGREVLFIWGNNSTLTQYTRTDYAGLYTIAYDYNTDWRSEIGDFSGGYAKANNDPIREEIIKGQYLSASIYNTIACQCIPDIGFACRIMLDINDSYIGQIESYSASSTFWLNTSEYNIHPGDTFKIEYGLCEDNIGIKHYTVIEDCRVRYVLYYVNKMGGVDHLLMKGRTTESYKSSSTSLDGNYDRSRPSDFQRRKLHTTATRTLLMNTGALTNAQSAKMDNLLLSPKVWVHDLHEGVVYAANITGSSFTVNRMPDSNTNSNNYALSLEIAQDVIRKG